MAGRSAVQVAEKQVETGRSRWAGEGPDSMPQHAWRRTGVEVIQASSHDQVAVPSAGGKAGPAA